MQDFIIAIILGIIEGITEFLPISSTGHLIIFGDLLGFSGRFADIFSIFIQLGAVLSVIVHFRERIFPFSRSPKERSEAIALWKKSAFAVFPILVLGALFADGIERLLFNPFSVAIALVIGGIALLLIENKTKNAKLDTISSISYKTAFAIGIIQCLALIPGTSRSAATIIGAMLLGSSRQVAAEFSFFLAIPTIAAASLYSLLKNMGAFTAREFQLLSIGFFVSFIVALGVISVFMKYIRTRDFRIFGYYRVALGLAIIVYFMLA